MEVRTQCRFALYAMGDVVDRMSKLDGPPDHETSEELNVRLFGALQAFVVAAKTYLACALADRACRRGFTAVYCRLPRLVFELALARADGTYLKVLAGLARVELLILDDWGLVSLDAQASADVMDVVDDRAGLRSTIVTSQLPVSEWHSLIADASIADALLDRLVHRAVRIELKGESMRKQAPQSSPKLT